ncbi:MAG: pro-sigmaK processing inhibitor BofA family protein [Halobacteriota archaeon]
MTELIAICLKVIKDLHHRHLGLLQDDRDCAGVHEVVLKKDRQDTKRPRSLAGDQSHRRKKSKNFFHLVVNVTVMAISRTISYLVVNSIFGLIVLALAKYLGLPVPINWITVLICALAGIPGALLVILLYWLGLVIPIIIAL